MIVLQLTEEQLKALMKSAAQEGAESALKNACNLTDDLLSKVKTAEYFNVSLPTITEWERQKRIHGIRFGHRVYFKKSDLLRVA